MACCVGVIMIFLSNANQSFVNQKDFSSIKSRLITVRLQGKHGWKHTYKIRVRQSDSQVVVQKVGFFINGREVDAQFSNNHQNITSQELRISALIAPTFPSDILASNLTLSPELTERILNRLPEENLRRLAQYIQTEKEGDRRLLNYLSMFHSCDLRKISYFLRGCNDAFQQSFFEQNRLDFSSKIINALLYLMPPKRAAIALNQLELDTANTLIGNMVGFLFELHAPDIQLTHFILMFENALSAEKQVVFFEQITHILFDDDYSYSQLAVGLGFLSQSTRAGLLLKMTPDKRRSLLYELENQQEKNAMQDSSRSLGFNMSTLHPIQVDFSEINSSESGRACVTTLEHDDFIIIGSVEQCQGNKALTTVALWTPEECRQTLEDTKISQEVAHILNLLPLENEAAIIGVVTDLNLNQLSEAVPSLNEEKQAFLIRYLSPVERVEVALKLNLDLLRKFLFSPPEIDFIHLDEKLVVEIISRLDVDSIRVIIKLFSHEKIASIACYLQNTEKGELLIITGDVNQNFSMLCKCQTGYLSYKIELISSLISKLQHQTLQHLSREKKKQFHLNLINHLSEITPNVLLIQIINQRKISSTALFLKRIFLEKPDMFLNLLPDIAPDLMHELANSLDVNGYSRARQFYALEPFLWVLSYCHDEKLIKVFISYSCCHTARGAEEFSELLFSTPSPRITPFIIYCSGAMIQQVFARAREDGKKLDKYVSHFIEAVKEYRSGAVTMFAKVLSTSTICLSNENKVKYLLTVKERACAILLEMQYAEAKKLLQKTIELEGEEVTKSILSQALPSGVMQISASLCFCPEALSHFLFNKANLYISKRTLLKSLWTTAEGASVITNSLGGSALSDDDIKITLLQNYRISDMILVDILSSSSNKPLSNRIFRMISLNRQVELFEYSPHTVIKCIVELPESDKEIFVNTKVLQETPELLILKHYETFDETDEDVRIYVLSLLEQNGVLDQMSYNMMKGEVEHIPTAIMAYFIEHLSAKIAGNLLYGLVKKEYPYLEQAFSVCSDGQICKILDAFAWKNEYDVILTRLPVKRTMSLLDTCHKNQDAVHFRWLILNINVVQYIAENQLDSILELEKYLPDNEQKAWFLLMAPIVSSRFTEVASGLTSEFPFFIKGFLSSEHEPRWINDLGRIFSHLTEEWQQMIFNLLRPSEKVDLGLALARINQQSACHASIVNSLSQLPLEQLSKLITFWNDENLSIVLVFISCLSKAQLEYIAKHITNQRLKQFHILAYHKEKNSPIHQVLCPLETEKDYQKCAKKMLLGSAQELVNVLGVQDAIYLLCNLKISVARMVFFSLLKDKALSLLLHPLGCSLITALSNTEVSEDGNSAKSEVVSLNQTARSLQQSISKAPVSYVTVSETLKSVRRSVHFRDHLGVVDLEIFCDFVESADDELGAHILLRLQDDTAHCLLSMLRARAAERCIKKMKEIRASSINWKKDADFCRRIPVIYLLELLEADNQVESLTEFLEFHIPNLKVEDEATDNLEFQQEENAFCIIPDLIEQLGEDEAYKVITVLPHKAIFILPLLNQDREVHLRVLRRLTKEDWDKLFSNTPKAFWECLIDKNDPEQVKAAKHIKGRDVTASTEVDANS